MNEIIANVTRCRSNET